jgi:GntR family transcriptional regulator
MFYIGGGMTTGMRPLKAARVSLPTQTSEYIRELISSGQYQPGQQLPSEGEFARQLGISRPTLREALHSLELEGLIYCRHGVGTFVNPSNGNRLETGLEVLESIERLANRIGLETSMGAARIDERPAAPVELSRLGLETQTIVLAVERAIQVDHHPVAYLKDIVPAGYLTRQDLEEEFHGSVLDLLIKRGQPPLSYSLTSLAAVGAEPDLAALLEIQPHTPLMRMEARLYSREDHVIDYSVSHFVTGYFDFHVVRRIGL